MLMLQKNINWNDFPVHQKRGSCCIKETYYINSETGEETGADDPLATIRSRWVIDTEIPIFKNEGRDYIERLI
jgi:hypothetical protein